MKKKTKFLLLGSTITMLSGLGAILFLNYKKENPEDLASFDILRASPIKVRRNDVDDWNDGSLLFCKDSKKRPLLIINENGNPRAIFVKKLYSWGMKSGDFRLEFVNFYGRKEEVYIQEYDNDNFGIVKTELINFLLNDNEED